MATRWGILCQPADFQRVLGAAPRARSPHFSVHHVAGIPALGARRVRRHLATELSTGDALVCPPPVDDLPAPAPSGRWLGLVVPKRHAKRAVTRSLIKRQMRAVMQGHADQLAAGLWVLRLRAPVDKARFISAASDALRASVRAELAGLIQKALLARPAARGAAHG